MTGLALLPALRRIQSLVILQDSKFAVAFQFCTGCLQLLKLDAEAAFLRRVFVCYILVQICATLCPYM